MEFSFRSRPTQISSFRTILNSPFFELKTFFTEFFFAGPSYKFILLSMFRKLELYLSRVFSIPTINCYLRVA